ncbi:sulfotransferase [Rubellicoccus peritrichatus]|uniref:Sulfotransferase n=1 Tax=Rubellicoccus peritrichatus TaxID=3080537 RepID=A0AAQ3L835_9BACT|nr:sulfotransferase [Puniceicoccus sp. CR14]WOO40806.1 sulfotransferase [Puniceicoccus sp. CR14]
MRSGSSLLSNILSSNNGLCGYGETHRVYTRQEDLIDLSFDLCIKSDVLPTPRLVYFDKILHDYIEDESYYSLPNILFLFLIRDARDTACSTQRMFMRENENPNQMTLDYTRDRSKKLQSILNQIKIKKNIAALRYEDLVKHPNKTLTALRHFIGLSEALTPDYKRSWHTGVKGLGDSSDAIKTGKIVKAQGALNSTLPEEIQLSCEQSQRPLVQELENQGFFLNI